MANPKLGQEDQLGPHKKDGSFFLQLETDSPSGLCSATTGTQSRSELTEKTQENPHLPILRTTVVPGACLCASVSFQAESTVTRNRYIRRL